MDEPDNQSWPDKGLWIYPELAAKFLLSALVDSGVGFFLLLVLWLKYGGLIFAFGGVVIGSFVIWRIVRWVNRRDDPRVKRTELDPGAPPEPR